MPNPLAARRLSRQAIQNTAPVSLVAADYFWGVVTPVALPVPTITVAPAPSLRTSKVALFDTITFSFQSDQPAQAWKVKVVPATSSTESAGMTIPTTAGSVNTSGTTLAATTDQNVTIKGTDLETASAGDGPKVVKVFVQDSTGQWSV